MRKAMKANDRFKLNIWFQNNVERFNKITVKEVAAIATIELGFEVGESNISCAEEATGKTWQKTARGGHRHPREQPVNLDGVVSLLKKIATDLGIDPTLYLS